jgi:hypothetical protein
MEEWGAVFVCTPSHGRNKGWEEAGDRDLSEIFYPQWFVNIAFAPKIEHDLLSSYIGSRKQMAES